MDAFEDDDLIFLQAQFAAFVEAGAGVKVEGGQVNFLASVQRGQVAVENFDVHGVEVFKVVFPGGGARGMGAVHEIIVGSEGDGAEAADP